MRALFFISCFFCSLWDQVGFSMEKPEEDSSHGEEASLLSDSQTKRRGSTGSETIRKFIEEERKKLEQQKGKGRSRSASLGGEKEKRIIQQKDLEEAFFVLSGKNARNMGGHLEEIENLQELERVLKDEEKLKDFFSEEVDRAIEWHIKKTEENSPAYEDPDKMAERRHLLEDPSVDKEVHKIVYTIDFYQKRGREKELENFESLLEARQHIQEGISPEKFNSSTKILWENFIQGMKERVNHLEDKKSDFIEKAGRLRKKEVKEGMKEMPALTLPSKHEKESPKKRTRVPQQRTGERVPLLLTTREEAHDRQEEKEGPPSSIRLPKAYPSANLRVSGKTEKL